MTVFDHILKIHDIFWPFMSFLRHFLRHFSGVSDGETHLTSRLLNFNVDAWVHLNCALWSSEVYEAVNGGLHNFDKALARSKTTKCSLCHKFGATINCSQTLGVQQRTHCEKTFHFLCAIQSQCGFYKDKVRLIVVVIYFCIYSVKCPNSIKRPTMERLFW